MIPLFMMLAVVFIIVIVPAFLQSRFKVSKSSDIRIDRQQYKNEQAVIQEWIGGDTKMDHSCNSRSRRENYVKCR